MKRFIAACLCATLSATATGATLIHNINGYTLSDGDLQRFTAIEFEGEKINALYADDQALPKNNTSKRIDGKGATLLPGLIDAHGHVGGYGEALSAARLVSAESQGSAAEKVAAFAATSDSPWIFGRGWNQVLWPDRQFPSKQSLDEVSTLRPIALDRIDGHALWVNSKALELAGIDASTPDPEGGQILRDSAGQPTGVLVDNAMNAVKAVFPKVTDERKAAYLRTALSRLASFGLTSTHDARVDAQTVRAYQLLATDQDLPIRVYGMLDVLDPKNDPYLQKGPIIDSRHMLDIRSVKISADGALGSRGAALAADYSDQPGQKGLLLLSDQTLKHHISRAMAAGYQVNTHAIGDLANTRVLDFYESLIKEHDSAALRHRVEHSQILRVEDIPRFKQMGVIASIQPTHATSDKNMAGNRLGEQRLVGAYAWKSLLKAGTKMAGGSDFPVEHPNPFYGLHAAVTRQSQDDKPVGGWLPEQKISREQALSLFTEGAAYAAHQETVIGRLAPGYYADFILVEQDYFAMPEKAIWESKVLETWVAGKRVYAAP
ncbi:MAG: amidohydrolase [Halioglobus sp.]|nr:amidohydrolase [Halioglobus sp.]